ncbi:MAG TPA: 5'-methylthioadenosine nucleosidase [Planctomycetaceae bacterium]|jgi:adenosylhomocysteine nucleosidase|nr:5'-methylthioadenosine nucleosidase [Planctomycetaceae bacterium]
MNRGRPTAANSVGNSGGDSSGGDPSHADIGIVCALPIEMSTFLARCDRVRKYTGSNFVFRGGRYDGIRIVVVESGTGQARARRATHALLDAHSPKWVLSCGFAGALVPNIRVGDVVVADSIVDGQGQILMIDVGFPADANQGIHIGRLLTHDVIVRLVTEKQQLAARHLAIAVDMESLAVAQVCRERGARFLGVRVISDDLTNDLPVEVLSLMGPTGTTRVGAAIGAILSRPSSVTDMWKLRKSAQIAAKRLATFLDGVVVQLYNALH